MSARDTLKHDGGYRVLITGGRDFHGREAVFRALDRVHALRGVLCLISGCADGADTLGLEWAEARGIPTARYPVTRGEWKTIGKSAGILRNARMLREGVPDVCVAFPGGRGTADMVSRCTDAGVPVWRPCAEARAA